MGYSSPTLLHGSWSNLKFCLVLEVVSSSGVVMYSVEFVRGLVFSLVLVTMVNWINTGPSESDEVDKALAGWWKVFSTSYTKYNDTTAIIKKMEILFPKLVKIYSIGKSVNGLEMWVIRLTEDVNKQRPLLRPMVKIVANMHGDEAVGRSLSLMLATKLLEGYKKEVVRIKKILQSSDIHILYSVNPDGFEVSVEGSCVSERTGRPNKNRVDLNRNFPDQFYPRNNLKLEPETKNVMKWVKANSFVLSANLHGGALVASYPFDSLSVEVIKKLKNYANANVPSESPDKAFFVYLAKLYAGAHKTMTTQSGDQTFCIPGRFKEQKGVTNGADWYNVMGGMQDWNYVNSNCFEITFELSCCKYPMASELLTEWEHNQESLQLFLESVQSGVKGVVKGAKAGDKIHVQGISHPVTINERGEFWRLLVPGDYTISIEAKGFKKFTFPKTKVKAKSVTTINHTMKK